MVTQLKVYTSSDNQPSKEQSVKLLSENLKESHPQPNSVWFSLFRKCFRYFLPMSLPIFISLTPWTVLGIGKYSMNIWRVFPEAQSVRNLLAVKETPVRFLGREDPLEKG